MNAETKIDTGAAAELLERIEAAEGRLRQAKSRLESAATAFYRSRKAVSWNGDTLDEKEFRRRSVAHEVSTKAVFVALVERGEAMEELDNAKREMLGKCSNSED